ncbi:MAG: hypothetical protein Q8P76_01185 [bacterium]|nr:hypothetical protein [bacterium]
MIIGHEHLIKDFKNLVKNNQLAHGYIFFGEPQVGKFYFAKHLANLLENEEFEIGGRPMQDALILENATGIDAMREIKQFLWQKPVISTKRAVIINNAGGLTPEAQNSILKIAEEPPAGALLILIVDRLDNLLPPLLSRMQKIYFGAVKEAELGRPGRAVLKKTAIFKTAEKYALDFLKLPESRRSALIKDLIEDQKEQPEILDLFFEELILKLNQDPVKNYKSLKSALHRLFLIKNYNTNKRLQLEAIQ